MLRTFEPIKVLDGQRLICETCCGVESLTCEGIFLVAECDHQKIWLSSAGVAKAVSKGVRH